MFVGSVFDQDLRFSTNHADTVRFEIVIYKRTRSRSCMADGASIAVPYPTRHRKEEGALFRTIFDGIFGSHRK